MVKFNVLLVLLFCSFVCHSQWKQPSVSVASPNAGALAAYGEIPVSYFTGTPNISIPIYEIKGNKIGLPVSLSYHTGSVKPDFHPGWTGLGWNLLAGGVITRKQNKYPDELQSAVYGNAGYYFRTNDLNTSTWSSSLSTYSKYPTEFDVEPDEFNFNFLGYSGKFFLDQSGTWKVQCDKALTVSFNSTDFIYPFIYSSTYVQSTQTQVTKTFKKFTITDERGTKYTFGDTESAIEYSDDMMPAASKEGEHFIATSWYLTKIESADGSEVINLQYQRGPFVSYVYKAYQYLYVNSIDGGPVGPACTYTASDILSNGRIISPVYLTSIEMPKQALKINFQGSKCNDLQYKDADYDKVVQDNTTGGTLNPFKILDYNSGLVFDNPSDSTSTPKYRRFAWRKLNSISIVNSATNEVLKTFQLNYTEQTTRRLRLSSVDAKDKLGTAVYSYALTYDDNLLLPEYLKKIGDHWGFNNNTDFPTSTTPTPDFLNLRAPDETYTKAEILKTIQYPTGGNTEFEFESNKYASAVSQDRQTIYTYTTKGTAGGLRIKKILVKDGTGLINTKEYYYLKNYLANSDTSTLTSSGVLDAIPQYSFQNTQATGFIGNFIYSITSSNPVIPLSLNSSGRHIAYSEVVERSPGNGYSIYKFTNHDNGYKDGAPEATFNRSNVPYYPFSSRDFERGRLLNKADYNNSGKLLLETSNEYSRINETGKASRAVANNFFTVCPQDERDAVSRSAYLLYYYPFALTKQTVRDYSNDDNSNSYVEMVRALTVDDYQNVVEERFKNSVGDSIKVQYKYPYHFSTVSSSNPYTVLTSANIRSELVERRTFKVKSSTLYLLGAELNAFKLFGSNIYREKTYSYKTATPVTPSTLSATTYVDNTGLVYDSKYLLDATYSWSTSGDLIELTQTGNKPTSFIWSIYPAPTAQVVNAKGGEVFFDSFEGASGWDASLSAYDYTFYRTGRYAGRIDKSTSGEKYSHSSKTLGIALTAATKYKISGWVYSNGPSADLILFMKRTGETGYYSYRDSVTTTITGQWVYLEKDITVPADVTQLNVRLDNNGGGSVWFDDIRLHPSSAQMVSYTYEPLIGVSSQTDLNHKTIYFQYDAFGRLLVVRDENKNILKKYCYNYYGKQEDCVVNTAAVWQSIGVTRCKPCSTNANYIMNIQQHQEKDNNPYSSTYNTYRWVDDGVSSSCVVAAWQNTTTALRCKLDFYGNYTGEQEQEQKDMNPCSGTYNTTRWVVSGQNFTACPTCSSSNCSGANKKCVNNACETGIKVYTSSEQFGMQWFCTYHYEWSDNSWSDDYTEYSNFECY